MHLLQASQERLVDPLLLELYDVSKEQELAALPPSGAVSPKQQR